ncbi:MAG: Xaa-Pro peptidase family protein [bacterium]|nr:Xaa-Pro peptidase family protein [bacterium]MDA1292429.1 Xaa-Pro peptidase family protein [bacterium]
MRPARTSEILTASKTDAFLVTNLTNIHYLSGREVSTGFVLITAKKMTLLVDSRYREAAEKSVRKGIKVDDIDALKSLLKPIKRCGFESEDVTVARRAAWKKKLLNTKFVQSRGIIEEFRRSKEPDELQHFRKAQAITHQLMDTVPTLLKGSITEKQLAEKLRQIAIELGADELSFDPIVAFGTHTSSPHHHPSSRKLSKGHIVQIDIGARVNGYCADQSQVFFTAKKTPLQKKVYDALNRAKRESIAAIKSGVTNHQLDKIARDILKEDDLEQYFTHSLGHGVGLDIHEGVSISGKAKKQKLLKNEIITIEPGVYIPGKFGMRLEEEIIVM